MSHGHALVAPSGAARVVQCPGSLLLERQYPEEEDEAALDGTAAHWVLEQAMARVYPPVGSPTPNGRVVTDEMVEGADLAVQQVLADLAPFGLGLDDVAVEVPVDIKRVHEQCAGTPDLRAWVPAERHPQRISTLYLWDYKFGHRQVEVFENYQIVAYAVGALDQTKLNDLQAQAVLGIIQPRAFHRDGPCRWWKVSMSALRPLVNIYSGAAHKALAPNPPVNTGPECRDCLARHACPTLQRSGYSLVEMSGKAQALELGPEALGLELGLLTDAIARLTARQTGLQAQAASVIRRGTRVPGWEITSGQGRKVWKRPAAEVIQLAALMGVNVAKPVEVMTPIQAEKAGLSAPLVAAYSETMNGAATLTRDNGSKARKVFAQ